MSAGFRVNSNLKSVSSQKPVLYLALELGWTKWKLAFGSAPAEKPRRREVEARNRAGLLSEIASAKQKLGLPADCEVVSCYEAGRDGFWIRRWLETQGVRNVIVDSSSIEVNRRARRAKSDGLDAAKLLSMLFRHAAGEKVWSVVRVPTEEEEQARQLQWYVRRFAKGNSRQRRVGIVALARKLLVALWKYLETGELPEGADLADWRSKTRTSVCSLDLSPVKRRQAS